jgi:uncharacterized protein (DUF1778 family)
MKTKNVNLREMPEELVLKSKLAAALQGLTLKGFIINALEKALHDFDLRLASAALFGTNVPKRVQRRKQTMFGKSK